MGINDWRNQLFQVQMSVYAKAVGCALACYYRNGQLCYPSIQTLCMDCCLSKPTVIKAIKELEEHKLIIIRKKQLQYLSALTNYYEFNGVTDSQSDGKSDSQSDGKPRLPEIREVREDKKENTLKGEKENPSNSDEAMPEITNTVAEEKINSLKKFELWEWRNDDNFCRWIGTTFLPSVEYLKRYLVEPDEYYDQMKDTSICWCKSKGKSFKDYISFFKNWIRKDCQMRGLLV